MSNNQAPNRPKFRIIASLILAVVAIGIWSLYLNKEETPSAADNSRALIGGAFELTDHNNQPVTDKDFLGKYMIVYFGYTYCPDVCPMDLQIMADSMRNLPDDLASKVTPVFVTIDPERDTVDVMAEYVQFFHEDLIGLTGTVEQVDTIKKAYRVYAAKADETPDYLVDHTAYTYLMDTDGSLLKHFNHGEDPEQMASIMATLIK